MNTRPWLANYDEGVPTHIDYPNIPLHELFFAQAIKFGDHVCLSYHEMDYSYTEANRLVMTLARSLIALGLQPGQRIGVILPNIPEFVICYYAILLAGGIVVPLNPAYTNTELAAQIQKTQTSIIIGSDNRIEQLRELKQKSNLQYLILCGRQENKKLSVSSKMPFKSLPGKDEFILEDLLIESNVKDNFPQVEINWPAVFQFSGGTTGTPKAAVALHQNIVANTFQFRNWLHSLKDTKEQFLTVIPLSHVYGMVIGLNVGIAMGATINLLSDPRNIGAILDTIQRKQISFYPGVPSMYHAINQNEDVKNGNYDLRTIKACISGSAPLLPEIRRQFENLTGGKLVEGYGLSEAPTATHCNPIGGLNKNGSIGLPLPDVDCRLEKLNDYVDGVGELCIKGPQVMSHYHENESETKNTIVDGWLKTGDIARMDQEGYFYIVGRKKELIKVGGLQVWPREVEEVIVKMPEIKEVAVAGIPDLARGEKVKAWVILKSDQVVSKEKIRERCADELAYFKIPSEIDFVSEFPRTPVGKVIRSALVDKEIK